MPDNLEVRGRLFDRFKHQVLDSAAVIIAALALLITSFSLMFAGIALYVANDAKEETEVYEIYVAKLHADLIAQGFEPPKLPQEE